ncbi:hypothetical protein OIN60_04220 [Paenibacillus sp. P96]|uniref:Transcriptional regulator n=1 Tax=Paenibacillus zeirhizosphaerae TaxID=2987519 RepID=A0ABT9FMP5_9BACL|nr:hypothetical protein [Paenibacillus sp. P96]MDP4095992.1 hypothetical protein [Paenibacillus sp. P96]
MNPKIRIVNEEILSDNWYMLKKITYMNGIETGLFIETCTGKSLLSN